jgi:hypothetical protein
MSHVSNDPSFDGPALSALLPLFQEVCDIVGNRRMIDDARDGMNGRGVIGAVVNHADDVIFDWLIAAASYQGIGDAIATSYMQTHGTVAASDIRRLLRHAPSCPKLAGYWTFEDCRFHKGSRTCAEPEHVDCCPLPSHDLRNGRLNQTAYSLFLFFRDVARGDFVSWLDHQLSAVPPDSADRSAALGQAILEPLGHVHGVSNKVLNMALSDLLLAMGSEKPLWLEAGAGMIAIDSLVHNWLHRTGILSKLDSEHPYGERCYGARGCEKIIRSASTLIDARQYNADYPADFPRFVQKAIWRFCAQAGLDICNGNRIDDRASCTLSDCPLGKLCQRRALQPRHPEIAIFSSKISPGRR